MFNRKKYYGLAFIWFMVDTNGCLGAFESGFGPIPTAVFVSEKEHDLAYEYFSNLPYLSNRYLASGKILSEAREVDNIFPEIKYVRRGLYFYDNQEYSNMYKLLSAPESKLKYEDLPSEIKNALKSLIVKGVAFEKTEELDITRYLDC